MPYHLNKPLRFDFENTASKADPCSFFAGLRDAGPVIPVALPFVGKARVTTTYDATSAMLKDNERFVQEARHAGKTGVAAMKWWMPRSLRLLTNNMLLKDEPDHRRLRKLVDQAFQRRHVRDMRHSIEQIADKLLDSFAGADQVDLANEYSRRLPLEVICELLGLPDQDRQVFSTWAKTATSMRNSFTIFRAFLSMRGVINYVRDQIEDCRREPREGLISELVRAEEDGDKLNEDELIAMVFLLLFAGFETTTHLISDSIVALDQNPDQKAYLLADPASRMERAVEELGRYTTPVQSTKPRYVAQDGVFCSQARRVDDGPACRRQLRSGRVRCSGPAHARPLSESASRVQHRHPLLPRHAARARGGASGARPPLCALSGSGAGGARQHCVDRTFRLARREVAPGATQRSARPAGGIA